MLTMGLDTQKTGSTEGWRPRFFALTGIALVLFLCYWPVLTNEYGYNDDYHFLLEINNHSYRPLNNETIPQGRPLEGMLAWLAYSMAGTIPNLMWLRLLSLLGIVCFCWTLYRLHRRVGGSRWFSVTTSLLAGLLPGVAVFIAWTARFYAGFCAAGAVLAGELIWSSFDASGGARRAVRLLLAVSILVAVCLVYQAVMPFCLYAVLVLFMEREQLHSRNFKSFMGSIAVFLAVAGIYFVIYRLIVGHFHGEGLAARGQLAFNPLNKLIYLGHLLWSGATLWAQFYSLWLQCVVAGIFLFVAILWLRNTVSARLIHPVLPGVCVLVTAVLSVLPIIVIKENDFEFRTQVPLQCLAVFVLMKGLSVLWIRVKSAMRDKNKIGVVFVLAMSSSLGLVAMFALLAYHHVRAGIVDPNAREWRCLKSEVARIEGDPRQVVFVSPEPAWMDKTVVGEFGIIASPAWWNTGAMLTLLLESEKDVHPGHPAPVVRRSTIAVLSAQGVHGTNPVVDAFGAIHGDGVIVKQDAYWGRLRVLPSGWCASDWFGCFDNRSFPWIWHSVLGNLYCGGRGNGEYHFLDKNLGWISTSPDQFPDFVVTETRVRKRLSTALLPKVDVYDYGSKTWCRIR